MREAFPIELPLRLIFEYSSIASLAEYLDSASSKIGMDINDISRILIQLNQLSDSQVQTLLAENGDPLIGRFEN
jgi:hypothetical protein